LLRQALRTSLHSFFVKVKAISPILWPAAIVSHGQDDRAFIFEGVDQREGKLAEAASSDAGRSLISRFRELSDQVFGPSDLTKEAASESGYTKFEEADFVQQLLFSRRMII
jgi:hypothetical protein